MNDRQRLEAIVAAVCKYLPPDGISKADAMNEIISLVDPLPELAKPEQEPRKEWVGLTDEERHAYTQSPFTEENYRAIEAKLKEKNGG